MKRQRRDRNHSMLLVTVIGIIGEISAFGIWMATNKLYTVIFTVSTLVTGGIVVARFINEAKYISKAKSKKSMNENANVCERTVINQHISGNVNQTIVCGQAERKAYDWAEDKTFETPKREMYDWEEDERREEEAKSVAEGGENVVSFSQERNKRRFEELRKQQQQ